ncbi:hypothetical protein L484_014774 [Morus notabilis]|uniref:Uncharacterized protein n=1 Tax=Morus notabilis TaxID=981085 RepID=W9SKI6_9ROSA|nr:hypothetical protein L484_014774 [Morus notabilis]
MGGSGVCLVAAVGRIQALENLSVLWLSLINMVFPWRGLVCDLAVRNGRGDGMVAFLNVG